MATLTGYRANQDEDGVDRYTADTPDVVPDGRRTDEAGEFSSDADQYLDDDRSDLIADSSASVSYRGSKHSALSLRRKLCILATVGIMVVAVIVIAIVAGKKNCEKSFGNDGVKVDAWDMVRLPENIVPLSYDVSLHPNLTLATVDGNTSIDINVTAGNAEYVLVHAKKMTISDRSLRPLNGLGEIEIKRYFFSDAQDFFVMEPVNALQPGRYLLTFQFNYSLNSGLVGFYGSQYKVGATGETRKLATTQFEPTDARKAFPCFDEPAMKAVFNISVVRDAGYTALSNMDIAQNETLADGRVRVHFHPTVRMSSYLVAFVVSDFQFAQGKTNNPSCPSIKVRVWCREEYIPQTSLALKVGIDVLSYYESFYNICYPLDKQDLVAIPDFAAGAMENWGLITYRETALLFDNFSSSTSDEQWVAVVIAHELAHQWFGNLVTMEWWGDLWLNEGFATFMEYIGAGHYAKELWDMQNQFMVDDFERALASDALASSHPILATVNSPSQINEIFDSISYSKGGSVLRMLRGVIGEPAFINGIRLYLQKHKFGNAKTADLWAAMDEVYSLTPSISKLMDTWTLQMGYPLVTVVKQSNGQLMASQKRFIIGGNTSTASSKFHSSFGYVWQVPVNFQTDVQAAGKPVFLHNSSIAITPHQPYNWIKLNSGNNFYYRVNYDTDNWQRLAAQLSSNHSVFTVPDRAGLMDDAFALANDGRINITLAMATTRYLEKEATYVPWLTAIDVLGHIGTITYTRPMYASLRAYVLKKIQVTLGKIGYTDTGTHADRMLRTALLHRSCIYQDKTCVKHAKQAVSAWMATGGPSPIPANLRTTYYATAVTEGDESEWDFFWSVYQNATVAVEKRKCLYALGQATSQRLLNRYLNWALDKTKIRPQDATSVMRYVAANPDGRLLAWHFTKSNWPTFLERYGEGSFSFSRLILSVTASFVTEYDLMEVKQFFEENPNAQSGQRATEQSLQKIQANIDWLARNEADLSTWLLQSSA